MSELYRKYRPDTFDSVYGQKHAVIQLKKIVERRSVQCFLLRGPSGVGKTTLARITAHTLGCGDAIREIPAAVFTGVDDMREVQELLQYQPFGENKARALIVDECHRLSNNAWDSILKATEEPPPGVYWFFCTTQADKMPKTMRTRVVDIKLREIDRDTLTDLIDEICRQEDIELANGVLDLVVREGNGSPRQALVNLELCRDVESRRAAAEILDTAVEDDNTLVLCRMLAQDNADWQTLMKQVEKLNGSSPEGVRIIIANYMASAARRSKTPREAAFFLNILESFAHSYGNADADAQLLRSLGQCVFAPE